MSEFKFACPVCGQHITADSSATGSELDCPTCFRKIVVPQASADHKFVLSASEAAKPRNIPPKNEAPATASASPAVSQRRSLTLIIVALALSILTAGAALYFFRAKLFSRRPANPAAIETNAAPVEAVRSILSSNAWRLDLADQPFPEATVSGKIHGSDFFCDRAVLQGGALTLRMGKDWPPDLGLTVFLFARGAEELAGKSALVTTNNIRSPRVALRWKEGDENETDVFTNGFALKIEFGNQEGNRLPGKIYICLPDPEQSYIAGTFNADIRKPSPPKPKPH